MASWAKLDEHLGVDVVGLGGDPGALEVRGSRVPLGDDDRQLGMLASDAEQVLVPSGPSLWILTGRPWSARDVEQRRDPDCRCAGATTRCGPSPRRSPAHRPSGAGCPATPRCRSDRRRGSPERPSSARRPRSRGGCRLRGRLRSRERSRRRRSRRVVTGRAAGISSVGPRGPATSQGIGPVWVWTSNARGGRTIR